MGQAAALSDDQKRCVYRATHRGTKEMDWLLGHYVCARGAALSAGDIKHLDAFMMHPDPLLEGWIMGRDAAIDPNFTGLVADIRRFHNLLPE